MTSEDLNSKLNNQLPQLLSKIIEKGDKSEISNEYTLQIFQIKEQERSEKKFFTLSLCDDKYKFSNVLIMESAIPTNIKLQPGHIITINKIASRKVKLNYFIIIKNFNLISQTPLPINNSLKDIKEEDDTFYDSEGQKIIKEENNLNTFSSKNENEEKNSEDPMEEEAYSSLKQLTSFSRDFIIFIRVTKKSEIKIFETRGGVSNGSGGQGKLFYFIVLDKEGNEMQVTCFNKACDKFFNIIEEDQLYEIKGGYVKLNDKKFTRIKSDYKIVLDENSKITKKVDNGSIKKHSMSIVKIKDIQNMNLYSIIDLCVVVLDVGEKLIKNTRNGSQPLKKVVVGDVSKYKIEISLWRSHSDTPVKFGDILLINNIKIGEFKGKNLSTFDETCIKINPPETNIYVKELEQFISKNDLKGEFKELENTNELNGENNKDNEKENQITVHIRDILESLDDIDDAKMLSKITATVTQILHNEKNFYGGCADRNCKRKLKFEGSDDFICPNCGKITKTPTYYYTLSLRVKDASCEYWIDIFGKTAESIMKCTAEEYKNYLMSKDDKKIKEITEGIEFKVFNFWVKPKLQIYNTVSKKKLYAYRIEEYNEKNEAHKLLSFLQKEIC